jgi:hypothetical protein
LLRLFAKTALTDHSGSIGTAQLQGCAGSR